MSTNASTASLPLTTVEQLATLVDGQAVLRVEAVIEHIGKRIANPPDKPGPYGGWSFQDLVLADGAHKFKATLNDRPEFPATLKGKRITFLSHKGDKGYSGLKIKNRPVKKGDPEKGSENVLWITGSAEHVNGSLSAGQVQPTPSQAADPLPGNEEPPRSTSTPVASRPPVNVDYRANVKECKEYLNRCANLYELCIMTVEYLCVRLHERRSQEYPTPEAQEQARRAGIAMHLSDDQQQAAISTMFISARDKGAFINDMPKGVLDKWLNPPASHPPALD